MLLALKILVTCGLGSLLLIFTGELWIGAFEGFKQLWALKP